VTVGGQGHGPALPDSGACGVTAGEGLAGTGAGDLGQLVGGSLPPGSFGVLLRACRHRACLSQEQLAARAELSERTVRNLEVGRVRSPRFATVRLLAGALRLGGPERESWVAAARDVTHPQGGPGRAQHRRPGAVARAMPRCTVGKRAVPAREPTPSPAVGPPGVPG
jgi:transcriptional regulator with XRE-family HTH domain